ncbi:hypothetical protein RvY_02660 [Ramazzottius varieornatus]|uniref:STAS domain-containing protein n=1 Tax=Ramazzottius varieornatus TaxID=947166 RepID=A0A1D1UNW9_RAMVA|nr:hypothetical protein RvY_02660 [Ramazzottius varieornatus]
MWDPEGSLEILKDVRRHLFHLAQHLQSFIPFLSLFRSLRGYRWRWVWRDFIAGVTVACFHIPQSMGTGMAANVGPLYGVHLTFFPGLIYAIFASSRHNSIGAFAPSAALAGVGVARTRKMFADPFMANLTYSELVSEAGLADVLHQHQGIVVGFTFWAGLFQLAMALFCLQPLSKILPFSVLDPFNCACSLQIILVQIPNMLGIGLDRFYGLNKHINLIIMLFQQAKKAGGLDTLLAMLTASITIGFREFIQPSLFRKVKLIVPVEFILMVAAIGLSYAFDLSGRYGVRIAGNSPGLVRPIGIPSPTMPSFEYLPHSFFEGMLAALVSIAVCLQAAKPSSRKHGYKVDVKQELVALGSANLFSSFFACFPASSNIGRVTVLDSIKSRSQLSTLFACLLTGLLLGFASQTLHYLPLSVIATIITLTLAVSLKLFEDLPAVWAASKLDAFQWVLTFIACVLLDVEWGLLIGLGFSLLRDQFLQQLPHWVTLDSPEASAPPSKVVVVGSSIDHHNAESLVESLLKSDLLEPNRDAPSRLVRHPIIEKVIRKRRDKPVPTIDLSLVSSKAAQSATIAVRTVPADRAYLILDCTLLTHVDAAGVRALNYLMTELVKRNTGLWFTAINGPVSTVLEKTKAGSRAALPLAKFAPSVDEALRLIDQEVRYNLTAVPDLARRNAIEVSTRPENTENKTTEAFWEVTAQPETVRETTGASVTSDTADNEMPSGDL